MGNLAQGYWAVGKMDKALPLLEATLQLKTAHLGIDHPDTLVSMGNLASGYKVVGKLDKALPLLEKTLQLKIARLGADHPDTLMTMSTLASGYQAAGKMDKGVAPAGRDAQVTYRQARGPTTPTHSSGHGSNLASGYKAVGKNGTRRCPCLKRPLS